METFEAIIPSYYLPYLINGDPTNLENDELTEINEWLKDQCQYFNCDFVDATIPENEPYFSHTNDVNGLGSDVHDVTFLILFNP